MSAKVIFELCAETLDACLAARDGGADRIELCSALSEDGLTPSHGFIRAAVELSRIPVHVLIRPRGGDFFYSDCEFSIMQQDVLHARSLGANGVVLGVLHADATVDVERTRQLVELAAPLEVSFHRAFDLTPSLAEALEAVIATRCRRVLTSGGQPDVVSGAASLRQLVTQAAGRIAIAAGGGVRLENARQVVQKSGVGQLHGSLRRAIPADPSDSLTRDEMSYIVDPKDIQNMMSLLHES
ncbi:MAG: copper homeostasis protein CutC [Edaphobacter sp.]|uniref:copper homeostasis protein CutC n=1 Tax=Edaphobacter sp. TaxID=1934404 RepID=UPI0023A48229|nr:copper homeostasis protein CutC [Edaphobacter sp.]MDE1177245.1 copper homeostasis protein CutC [Edaphobacter sp.]